MSTVRLSKKSAGRPPSVWVQILSKMNIETDRTLTKEEAAELFGTTARAVGAFCLRSHAVSEYRQTPEGIRAFYSLKALQEAARNYTASKRPS